ncbi:MAG: surface lipoprotein assembly modifier [Deltaproteobacteria bacterium]|nr:surface lipoprotein assembly modifier [Deltaproteobacteria bacterium]
MAAGVRETLLDEAIAAFRAMLIDQPGLVRVRLELARAFFYKGEDGLSREHFERVLAGNPPAPVVANVRRFLSRIRARRRWSVYLGFAVAPDTNIGGTSDERIIYIFGLPFRRDAASLTTSGVGLSVLGGGEYQHPLGERVRLRLGMDASRREYSGGKFDQMLVSWHAGPRVFVSRTTELSVLGNWRHQWTANDPNYFDLGGRLTLNHRFSRRLTASGRASWHDRRYRTRKLLDGPVRNFSLNAGWVLTPTVRLNATAAYGRDRPQSLRNRNESFWLQTGVSVALPKGFTVGGGGGVRWTNYEVPWAPHTPADERRKDTTYTLRASVFNRALTFFGFSPEVSLVHEVRNTNAQLYDYKRTGGELRVVRQF